MQHTTEEFAKRNIEGRRRWIKYALEGNHKRAKHKKLNPYQLGKLKEFYDFLERQGNKVDTVRTNLQNLKQLLIFFNKKVEDITKEDIDQYLQSLHKYKPSTILERKLFLIKFFRWVNNFKEKKEIPLIAEIKVKQVNGDKLPEELLSPEEIRKMVQVADNLRDKALIMLLYETASRRGEFLQLKIKHVDITNREYGFVTIPTGKTKSRKLPIIFSVPYLQQWLNSHPYRDNPEEPLFICTGSWRRKALGEDGLKLVLYKTTDLADIKKKVHPHLLRHSRLTELGKEITEQELKIFAGWTMSSNMPRVYIHLGGNDVANKILANAGLRDAGANRPAEALLRPVSCPRCEFLNPAHNKYCRCGMVLDLKEAMNVIDKKQSNQEAIEELMKTPQMQELVDVFKQIKEK